jgi:hypothetical protein
MNFRKKAFYLAVAVVAALGVFLVSWLTLRPLLLTQIYGGQLEDAIRRIEEITGTIDGQSNPEAIAQIATGEYLNFLLQHRCQNCSSVQVATKIDIQTLRVVEYSSDFSLVVARVEWGWHWVSPRTGIVDSICHAQAYTNVYPLAKEEGVWKITSANYWVEIDPNRVDDSAELRAKYCQSN